MTDLYLDVNRRIDKGELLPNFRNYVRDILKNENLRNLLMHYCKHKRENPNSPFLPTEEAILAIRNLALYGIFDSEYKQVVGYKHSCLSKTGKEFTLLKSQPYKINSSILAFLSDILMETINAVKINDAISKYYKIGEKELKIVKDWALKLSLLLIEPAMSSSYGFSHYMYALADSYKMNVLVCIYAKRHQNQIKWQGLAGCDFTLPNLTDDQFGRIIDEFGADKLLKSRDNEKFSRAFKRSWKRLNNFSDGQFGFKVVPKLNYRHFKRYLSLLRQGIKIDDEVKFQLINYLGFLSKIKPTFGLAGPYKQAIVEAFSPLAKKRARDASRNIEKKDLEKREKTEARLREELSAIIKDSVDKYDPLFLWEKIEKKDRNFVLGDIHATTDRSKFKMIPISKFIDDNVTRAVDEIRKYHTDSSEWEVLADEEGLDNMILSESERGSGKSNPEAKAERKNWKMTEVSIRENNKNKLLIIEDFADLVLKEVRDARLNGVSKSNLVGRLRNWHRTRILIPAKIKGKRRTRFYHKNQLQDIVKALDQAEMNQRHEIKGCYNLAKTKERLNFNKHLNTFRNRIKKLITSGKLSKNVKKKSSYIFTEEQLKIIEKELK